MSQLDPQLVNELLRNRRSVYPGKYTGEIVEESVIQDMLENANWAPTHRLTEPWRFVVFMGEGLERLAAFQSELYKEVSKANGTFDEVKFNKLATKPMMASHIIAIGMSRCSKESVPEEEELASVAMAVQNMYLTATAHEVGCYWGSGGVTYYEEAKPFFGLESDDKLLGFMYIGKVDSKDWPKGRRKPIEEKVKWVRS